MAGPADEKSGTENETRSEPREQRSLLAELLPIVSIGQLSGLITLFAAVAGPTYVFGVLTLWVQLSQSFGFDSSTAWYAMSLIPQTSVLGHAATMLIRDTAWLVFYGFLAYFMLKEVPDSHQSLRGTSSLNIMRSLIHSAAGKSLLFLVVVFIITRFIEWIVRGFPPLDIAAFAVAITAACAAGYLLGAPRFRGLSRPIRFALSLVVLYAGLLGNTILEEGQKEPPLPIIRAYSQVPEEHPSATDGSLLSHVDGYWYIAKRDEGKIHALPDDRLVTIVIGNGQLPEPFSSKPEASPSAVATRGASNSSPAP